MKIDLLQYPNEPLRIAFLAIRTCYSSSDLESIYGEEYEKYKNKINKDGEPDHIRLIKQIVNHGHRSTLEHLHFTFTIEGVSRALLAQLTRHRVGFSYSVRSQRYVKHDSARDKQFTYVELENMSEEIKEAFRSAMINAQESYDNLLKLGCKAEDARAVLPNAADTQLVLSCNLRSFMDLYEKRNSNTHAQSEIASMVELMKDLIIEKCPELKALF